MAVGMRGVVRREGGVGMCMEVEVEEGGELPLQVLLVQAEVMREGLKGNLQTIHPLYHLLPYTYTYTTTQATLLRILVHFPTILLS